MVDLITPEVGDLLEIAMPLLKNKIDEIVQKQYEVCQKKGFHLPKYYIWWLYYKNDHTGRLVFRHPICRVTRPSPYQEEDCIMWSVTNMDKVNFEWCIPKKEIVANVLAHPDKFDVSYVRMLKKYCSDNLEHASDYVYNDKVI